MSAVDLLNTMKQGGFLCVANSVLVHYKDLYVANVMATLVEQFVFAEKNNTTVDGWFSTTYQKIMERLYLPSNRIQSVVQLLITEGVIVRRHGNVCGRIDYKINADKITELFGSNSLACPESNDRTCPAHYDRTKDKDNRTEDKEPSLEKDSKEGATTSVATPAGNGLIRRRIKPPSLFPSQFVESLFNHWNNLGKPLSSHKIDPESKTFQSSVTLLTKALQKHQFATIKQAMDDYYKILTCTHTNLVLMRPGVKVSLPEFFKFSESTKERMIHHDVLLSTKSWFQECLLGWEFLENRFRTHEKDTHPKVTEALIQAYKDKISRAPLSVSDTNNFIRSARFIVQFHCDNKNRINWSSCLAERTNITIFAKRLVDAILEDAQDPSLISPQWMCSDRTQRIRFMRYMVKHGLISQGEPAQAQPQSNATRVRRAYNPGYQPGELE